MESPLNEMIEQINAKEIGERVFASCFTPFVISIMPDIACLNIMVLLSLKSNKDGIKLIIPRFENKSIISVNNAI